MPSEHVDVMVSRIQRDYKLCLVFTLWTSDHFYPLSVPSAGTFIVSLRDTGCASGFSLGVGLPLEPTCALVAIPVEERGKIDTSLLGPSLANNSVGISASKRVVLHPSVRSTFSEGKLRDDLKELRESNDTITSGIHEVRQKIVEGFALAGLTATRDRIGRVVPPMP